MIDVPFQVVLFDVGGVLYKPLDEDAVRTRRTLLAQQFGFGSLEKMWRYFFTGQEWEYAKTGKWNDSDMWSALLSPYGLKSEEGQQRFVKELYEGVGLDQTMRDLLTRLNTYFRLAILSNATDNLNQILFDRLEIGHFFDPIINSHEIGVAKPERQAFELTLEVLGVPASRVLFIDDQERNTKAAEELGIQSLTFVGALDLQRNLFNLGFKIT